MAFRSMGARFFTTVEGEAVDDLQRGVQHEDVRAVAIVVAADRAVQPRDRAVVVDKPAHAADFL